MTLLVTAFNKTDLYDSSRNLLRDDLATGLLDPSHVVQKPWCGHSTTLRGSCRQSSFAETASSAPGACSSYSRSASPSGRRELEVRLSRLAAEHSRAERARIRWTIADRSRCVGFSATVAKLWAADPTVQFTGSTATWILARAQLDRFRLEGRSRRRLLSSSALARSRRDAELEEASPMARLAMPSTPQRVACGGQRARPSGRR